MVEKEPSLHIIIPTCNESKNIERLLPILQSDRSIKKVTIVDSPFSTDNMRMVFSHFHDVHYLISKEAGRAPQMNAGAAENHKSDILCFVHADVIPCSGFGESILNAIDRGADAGCFSYCFDSQSFWLNLNAKATKYHNIFTGGGDQAIFIKSEVFDALGGFDEDFVIMEDFDLVRRCKAAGFHFELIKKDLKVSARKYTENSYLKVNIINGIAFLLFYLNISPKKIQSFYQYWIN